MISGTSTYVEVDPLMRNHSSDRDAVNSLFKTIPPERVGIDGQYDYNGLANRVRQELEQSFGLEEMQRLTVRQRGTIVVLMGELSSQQLLQQIRRVAIGVSGATDVETHGVKISRSCNSSAQAFYV